MLIADAVSHRVNIYLKIMHCRVQIGRPVVCYCVCSAMMFSITGHNTVIVTGFGEHAGGERAYYVLRGIILSSSAVSFLNVVQFGQYLYAQKSVSYTHLTLPTKRIV